MSTPTRQVVLLLVEVVGTVDADTPEAEIEALGRRAIGAVEDELAGELRGLCVSATLTNRESGTT